MLASLTVLQFAGLFLQGVLLVFGLYDVETAVSMWAAVVAGAYLALLLGFQHYWLRDLSATKFPTRPPASFYHRVALLGALFVSIVLAWRGLGSVDSAKHLNALSDTQGIGLAYKAGNVFVPALAFAYYATTGGGPRALLVVCAAGAFSGVVANTILSKAPLVPYVLFTASLIVNRRLPAVTALGLGVVVFTSVVPIYVLRESSGTSSADVALLLVFRLPLVIETARCLEWMVANGTLDVWDPFAFPTEVTFRVFGRDGESMGVAPSYAGFWFLSLGIWGGIAAVTAIYAIGRWLNLLLRPGAFASVGILLYYLWAVELVSFFVDGIPWFFISTRGARMFWILLTASLVFICVREAIRRHRGVKAAV